MQENKEKSLQLLEYMISEGFNPNNYAGVLELLQSAPNCISKYLTEYNQYLLSKEVVYSELAEYGVDGAYGYLADGGIYVPKTLGNDIHFLYDASKVPYIRHGYNYPSIDEFGVIVFSQELVTPSTINAIVSSLRINQDNFFGFVLEKDKDNQKKIEVIERCYQMAKSVNDNYKFEHTSKNNNALYLIKKKK